MNQTAARPAHFTVRRLIEFLESCEPNAPVGVVGTGLLVSTTQDSGEHRAAGVLLSADPVAARAPHEVTIGVGAVLLAEGVIDDRPCIILRPKGGPRIFDEAGGYSPQDDDTILWVDGHPDMLIRALMTATIHHLPY